MLLRAYRLLLTGLFWATSTKSQAVNSICAQELAEHNVSNIVRFEDDSRQIQNLVGNPAWAITVDDYQNQVQTNLWYSNDGRNTSNSKVAGFDGCTLLVWNFPKSTLLRASSDNGICTSALSPSCYKALVDTVTFTATRFSNQSLFNSESATTPNGDLCQSIQRDGLGNDNRTWPQECWDEFGYNSTTPDVEVPHTLNSTMNGVTWNAIPLAGDVGEYFDFDCTLQSNASTFASALVNNLAAPSIVSNDAFSDQVNSMYLAVTVYSGVANRHRTNSTQQWTSAQLSCLRAINYSSNSDRTASPLAGNETQHEHHDGKSGTTLASGILGSIVPVVFISTFIVIFMRRIKIKKTENAFVNKTAGSEKDSLANEVPGNNGITELGVGRKREPGGSITAEMNNDPIKMEAGSRPVYEMSPGEAWLVELPGDSVHAKRRVSI